MNIRINRGSIAGTFAAVLMLAAVQSASASIISMSRPPGGGDGAVAMGGYMGVGQVGEATMGFDRFGCTGTLIRPNWVLTAAHCLTKGIGAVPGSGPGSGPSSDNPHYPPSPYNPDDYGSPSWDPNPAANPGTLVKVPNLLGRFRVPEIGTTVATKRIVIHPEWNGNIGRGFDIALMELDTPLAGVTVWGYDGDGFNAAGGLPGLTTRKVGYGLGGDAVNGENSALFPYGTKRSARNTLDAIPLDGMAMPLMAPNRSKITGNAIAGMPGMFNEVVVPGSTVIYDFDDHLMAATTGPFGGAAVGADEGVAAHGDSGGPMMYTDPLSGEFVVSITSYGVGKYPDTRLGSVEVDTRIAPFAPWINQTVPEPATLTLLAASILLMRRRVL